MWIGSAVGFGIEPAIEGLIGGAEDCAWGGARGYDAQDVAFYGGDLVPGMAIVEAFEEALLSTEEEVVGVGRVG